MLAGELGERGKRERKMRNRKPRCRQHYKELVRLVVDRVQSDVCPSSLRIHQYFLFSQILSGVFSYFCRNSITEDPAELSFHLAGSQSHLLSLSMCLTSSF